MCNCGSLICALTGTSAAELAATVPPLIAGDSSSWTNLAGQYCPITGMPTHELFRKLMGYGLTTPDIINLEYLRDPKVLSRMNVTENRTIGIWPFRKTITAKVEKLDHTNKKHVIAYMRTWADLLTEEGAMDVPDTESSHTTPTLVANV